MRKIVSFASTPNEAIKWSELGKYKRLSKEELYIYDFENIEEVHFIGSKKGENDYEIEETKWGIYINMEEAILLYICSWQTKEFQLLEKINKNIKCLDIRFTSINELDISEFDKINKLVLSNNRYLGLVNGIEKISGLRELYLNNSSIEKNPDLNNFPEIYVLNLSNTLISDLEGDEVRRNCKFLDLSNTKIKSCKTIQIFPNLRRLSLQETDIVSLKGIEQLKKLESLNCRDTRIETINEVMNLEALTSLNISYTNIKTLDKVMFPNTIRSLVMDGIGIKTIPVNICMLKNLRKLGISNMHLDSLPPEILDLQLNFNIDEEARKRNGINLFNTKIDNMDESVLQQPRTIISAWFKNNNRVRIPKKLNEAKVVFLGDGGAGKTFSIQRLLNNCEMQEEFSGESTPGISIQDCKYEINGEEILIHYWDFGGQEIMHSMHRMFLTKRTLYVVFVNARDNTQDERARYWLHDCKNDFGIFFLNLEKMGRCIYRRYQIWVENKLFSKGNREKFLYKLLETDNIPSGWKVQTIVGIVKSNFCSELFEEYKYYFSNDLLHEFLRLTNIFSFETSILNFKYGNVYSQLKPIGMGRPCLINLIFNNGMYKEKSREKAILKLCTDYSQNPNICDEAEKSACQILQFFIEEKMKNSLKEKDFNLADGVNLCLMPIYKMAKCSHEWIKHFWSERIFGYLNSDGRSNRLDKEILKYVLKNTVPALAIYLPKELCEVADAYWIKIPKCDARDSLYRRSSLDSVEKFGLSRNSDSYHFEYRNIYDNAFLNILITYNWVMALEWLIKLTNHMALAFRESVPEAVYDICVWENSTNEARNYICSPDFWLAGIQEL